MPLRCLSIIRPCSLTFVYQLISFPNIFFRFVWLIRCSRASARAHTLFAERFVTSRPCSVHTQNKIEKEVKWFISCFGDDPHNWYRIRAATLIHCCWGPCVSVLQHFFHLMTQSHQPFIQNDSHVWWAQSDRNAFPNMKKKMRSIAQHEFLIAWRRWRRRWSRACTVFKSIH